MNFSPQKSFHLWPEFSENAIKIISSILKHCICLISGCRSTCLWKFFDKSTSSAQLVAKLTCQALPSSCELSQPGRCNLFGFNDAIKNWSVQGSKKMCAFCDFCIYLENAECYLVCSWFFLILYSLVQFQMSKKYRSTKEQFLISAITISIYLFHEVENRKYFRC